MSRPSTDRVQASRRPVFIDVSYLNSCLLCPVSSLEVPALSLVEGHAAFVGAHSVDGRFRPKNVHVESITESTVNKSLVNINLSEETAPRSSSDNIRNMVPLDLSEHNFST